MRIQLNSIINQSLTEI